MDLCTKRGRGKGGATWEDGADCWGRMGKLKLKLVCCGEWAGKVGMTKIKSNLFSLTVSCKCGGRVKYEISRQAGGDRSMVKLQVV